MHLFRSLGDVMWKLHIICIMQFCSKLRSTLYYKFSSKHTNECNKWLWVYTLYTEHTLLQFVKNINKINLHRKVNDVKTDILLCLCLNVALCRFVNVLCLSNWIIILKLFEVFIHCERINICVYVFVVQTKNIDCRKYVKNLTQKRKTLWICP